MLALTTGLAAASVILLAITLASLAALHRRAAALARVEAKLDLLLDNAGLEYDPWTEATPDVIEALRRGDKIGAIKRYREATGASLMDAKSHVEELDEARAFEMPSSPRDRE